MEKQMMYEEPTLLDLEDVAGGREASVGHGGKDVIHPHGCEDNCGTGGSGGPCADHCSTGGT